MVAQHPAFTGVIHVNTGIGIEQTREFVRNTCADFGWPLFEYKAEDLGIYYKDLILEMGFPGPPLHKIMYSRLKERCIRQILRDFKRYRRDKIMFITGIRRSESKRRMGYERAISKVDAQLWVAPMLHFLPTTKNEYMRTHNLPRNEVVDLLHMSGECLCGAYARPNELEEIAQWFPEVADHIRQLEQEAKEAGVHCVWGKKPSKKAPSEQLDFLPLCVDCSKI